MKFHALVISDIHLGSKVCQTDKILEVLNNTKFSNLIINGDLIDSTNLHRFKKSHWKILSKLRKLTKKHKIILTTGNHAPELNPLMELLGIKIEKDYVFYLNKKKFIITHGNFFDEFLINHPILTEIFTGLYYYVQKFCGRNQILTRFLKRFSKKILKVHTKIKDKAVGFAKKHSAQTIIVGHSHFPDIDKSANIDYFNCGSFCESICTYLLIDNKGNVKLQEI